MSAPRTRHRRRRITPGHNDPETLARLRLTLEAQLDAVHEVLEAKRIECEAARPGRAPARAGR